MKIEVKTRRKIGSSFAHPARIMLRYASSSMSPSPSWTTGTPQTVPLSTSRVTASGWAIAYARATAEPPDMPRSANRSRPAASTTASRSPSRASRLKSSTSQSDMPKPRSS